MDRIKHFLYPSADGAKEMDEAIVEVNEVMPEFHLSKKEMLTLFNRVRPRLEADYLLSQEEATTIKRLIKSWDKHLFSLKWDIWSILDDPEPVFIDPNDGSLLYLPTDDVDEHDH